MDQLISTLYQAAADTRLWEPALAQLAAYFNSASAGFLTYRGVEATAARNTGCMREIGQAFVEQRMWERDGRICHFLQAPIERFVTAEQYFGPEMLAENEIARMQAAIGLRHQAGTIVRVGVGDHLAAFALDRTAGEGPFSPRELARLDRLRPHLTGAAQLTHHLAGQRATQVAAVLQAIGQPAAVLDRRGAVLACNALFEADAPLWAEQGMHGCLRLRDRRAQALLAAALPRPHGAEGVFLVRAPHGVLRRLQLRPLLGAARESLLGGHALLLADAPPARAHRSPQARLRQRHGLTAREAELACLLAAGGTLKQCADALSLAYNTARTYLNRIHAKTGTRRLPELVRLVLDEPG